MTPPTTPRTSKSPTPVREKTPTHDDTMAFLGKLALCKSKPAILSVVEPYSSQYVPKSLDSSFPVCLSQIFKSENLNLNYSELLSIATNYQITVTEQQTAHVESKTRLQANSQANSISKLSNRIRYVKTMICKNHISRNQVTQE